MISRYLMDDWVLILLNLLYRIMFYNTDKQSHLDDCKDIMNPMENHWIDRAQVYVVSPIGYVHYQYAKAPPSYQVV